MLLTRGVAGFVTKPSCSRNAVLQDHVHDGAAGTIHDALSPPSHLVAPESLGMEPLPLDDRILVSGDDSWPKLGAANATTALVHGASATPGQDDSSAASGDLPESPLPFMHDLKIDQDAQHFQKSSHTFNSTFKAVRRQSNAELVELELFAGMNLTPLLQLRHAWVNVGVVSATVDRPACRLCT